MELLVLLFLEKIVFKPEVPWSQPTTSTLQRQINYVTQEAVVQREDNKSN